MRTVSMLYAFLPEAAMTDDHGGPPPIRFVDAQQVNPFQVSLDLHDHAIGRPATPSRCAINAELTLAAAVVSWRNRWQPMSIHAALYAGVDLADIGAASGLDSADVVRWWLRWADVQVRLTVGGQQAMDVDEVRTIRRQLRIEVDL